MSSSPAQPAPAYPVTLAIDHPDRPLDRVTSFFRVFTVIPIGIIIGLMASGGVSWETTKEGGGWSLGATAGVLFLPTLLMILFQQKYPRWWYEWNVALVKFGTRVISYLALMNDQYPSTDEEKWVHIGIPYPDVRAQLSQWMPLVKWFLAIPHYIVLAFLVVAAVFVVILAWFAILFTRRYPRGFFDFVTGVMRWALRVQGYAFLLVTDTYPPFSLS
jgi:hypothetical protein